MQAAGLETRGDALGNLAGRRGPGPVLVIGSHLDSVADAGRYDGILGVLVGLAVAEATDVALEVVAFADEEGLRFQATFLGSRAFVGRIDPGELDVRDHDGITARRRARRPAGRRRSSEDARAYFEVHIEQGPVLEAEDAPLGVVTAIAGQTPLQPHLQGPRRPRGDDADAPAPRRARPPPPSSCSPPSGSALDEPGLVATVGELGVPRGACNVIPGRVEATLDIRHQDDAVRERAIAALRRETEAIAQRRGVSATWSPIHEHGATPCTPALVAQAGRRGHADGTSGPRTPQRRRARCGHHGRGDRDRDALRPLHGRQPQPGRARRGGRRRAGDRGGDPLRGARTMIVKGGKVVTADGVIEADVAISDGVITAVQPGLDGEFLDATGLHVFPGGLDPHVHFNEPGRTHWEGLASGSAALARGGFTAFFDMPLNSTPPTADAAAFDAKLAAARARSSVDFGLWGALVPGNRVHMEALAERGVIGFKAFMSHPGTEELRPRGRHHALRGDAGGRAARPARRRPRRERRPDVALARPDGTRLHGLAAGGRRARGDRPRDRVRRGDRLRAAHRARVSRAGASRWSPPRGRAAST